MQKYKQAAISIAFLTFILTAGLSFGSFESNKQIANTNSGSTVSVLETLEKGDYQAWKRLIAKRNDLASLVSESDFKLYGRAREAARSGNYDQAIAQAKELEVKLKEIIGSEYFA